MKRGGALCLVLALLVAACGSSEPLAEGGPDGTPPAAPSAEQQWVPAWSTSLSNPEVGVFAAQTLRQIIHPLRSGTRARLRLSNRYQDASGTDLTLSSVWIGVQQDGAALVPGSNRRLRFGGKDAVTIPKQGSVVSDPFDFPVQAFRKLVVSLHNEGPYYGPTIHYRSREALYTSGSGAGDHAGDEDASAFSRNEVASYWILLEGLEVEAAPTDRVLVAFGDGLTDGFVSGGMAPLSEDSASLGSASRYPDLLARRLAAMPGDPNYAVANAGIMANALTLDAKAYYEGPSGLSRFATDVLAVPGATDVLILAGIQDLLAPERVAGETVIAALQTLIAAARAEGLNVLLGTLPPAGGAAVGGALPTGAVDAERREVNDWIRSRPSGVHGVVDFDAALRDSAAPDRLRPEFDSGDHLHPNNAGYTAMAQAVDLQLLRHR